MKRILFAITLVLGISANAQEFKERTTTKVKKDTTTTYTYRLANDSVCKVYVGGKGSFYIWKVSKNGRKKVYLPKDIQIAMGRKY